MKKLISNQISPNFTYLDSLSVLSQIRHLWNDKPINFSDFLGTENYKLTNAARTALTKIIEVVHPDPTKKIGIPAFCCSVMATPFIHKNYSIEWIDTDENGRLSVDDFRHKAHNISLVIVPHIFGQKAPIADIWSIAKDHDIFVVEDCAHLHETSLDYCDAKIFSFGREKVFSCVCGGALTWPEDSPYHEQFQFSLFPAKKTYTLKHLLHPTIFAIALPLWHWGKIGKGFVWGMNKLNIIPRAVTPLEKKGVEDFPQTKLPRPLQEVLRKQWKRRARTHTHRRTIAKAWYHTLSELFPDAEIIVPDNAFRVLLKTGNTAEIRKIAKSWGFDLREWDGNPIAPKGVDLEAFEYTPGQCPTAEYFSNNYISFPTNIRTKESDVEYFRNLWKLTIKE